MSPSSHLPIIEPSVTMATGSQSSSSYGSLPLVEVRRTQRRVAALLHQSAPNVRLPKVERRPISVNPLSYCVCSKLDPEGKYARPEMNFLRDGIDNARRFRELERIKLRQQGKDKTQGHVEAESRSYGGWMTGAGDNKGDSTVGVQPKDIEAFSYAAMEASMREDEVQLPHIAHKQVSSLMPVPVNSPVRTANTDKHGVGLDGLPVLAQPPGDKGTGEVNNARASNSDILVVDNERKGAEPRDSAHSNVVDRSSGHHANITHGNHGNNDSVDYMDLYASNTGGPTKTGGQAYTRVYKNTQPADNAGIHGNTDVHSKGVGHSSAVIPHKKGSRDPSNKNIQGNQPTHYIPAMHSNAHGSPSNQGMNGASEGPLFTYKHSPTNSRGYCCCESPLLRVNSFVDGSVCGECGRTGGSHEVWCYTASASTKAPASPQSHQPTVCQRCGGVVRSNMQKQASFVRLIGEDSLQQDSASRADGKENGHGGGGKGQGAGDKKVKRTRSQGAGGKGKKGNSKRRHKVTSVQDMEPSTAVGVDGTMGQDPQPVYLQALDDLDSKLESGAFDFDTELQDVRDIGGALRFGSDNPDDQQGIVHSKYQGTIVLHPDGYREAYLRALAAAQWKRAPPLEPWMLSQRISRAFVFSYMDCIHGQPSPRQQPLTVKAIIESSPQGRKGLKGKKFSEMRHIFGNIKVEDYYPGGKCNPIISHKHNDDQ